LPGPGKQWRFFKKHCGTSDEHAIADLICDLGFLASDGRISFYSLGELAPHENWFIPTLEELIEACEKKEGYHHFRLEHPLLGWVASIEAQDEQTYCGSHQATAEEAVARLWLALKKQ
jgi:hypothetical protein